jgi:hypothetical protein
VPLTIDLPKPQTSSLKLRRHFRQFQARAFGNLGKTTTDFLGFFRILLLFSADFLKLGKD